MLRPLVAILALAAFATPSRALDVTDWKSVEQAARGETVYFNALGRRSKHQRLYRLGRRRDEARLGVTLVHVKLEDTANAVANIVAEKAAGKDGSGSVDLSGSMARISPR